MFNLERAHFVVDEMISNGKIIESNKDLVVKQVQLLDRFGETAK